MTLLEAIHNRHSVRRYRDIPMPDDVTQTLRDKIEEINRKTGLHIQFVTDERKAFKGVFAYGKFSGVNSYFVMAGRPSEDFDETVGYYGEQLVLLAQQLGLNTCWAGLSYQKVAGTYSLRKGEKIACYIAVGYGETQGSPHKSRTVGELSNMGSDTPEWFSRGVVAAMLAPTAVNQQKFYLEYCGKRDGRECVHARRRFSMVGYTRMDLGIVKLHFEIGAAPADFVWC